MSAPSAKLKTMGILCVLSRERDSPMAGRVTLQSGVECYSKGLGRAGAGL